MILLYQYVNIKFKINLLANNFYLHYDGQTCKKASFSRSHKKSENRTVDEFDFLRIHQNVTVS